MIAARSAIAPFALLVGLTTTTISFAMGVADAPHAFVGDDDVLLLGPTEEGIGRGTIAREMAVALAALDGVRVVSPEVYVAVALKGGSVFARGVDHATFFALEEIELSAGRMPEGPREALVGERFASRFDVDVGDTVVLPSSLRRFVLPVTVVGRFDSGSPARDEILIDLDTARQLAELDQGEIHVVRAAASDPGEIRAILRSVTPVFTYSDVRLSAGSVVQGEPVVLHAKLTNWGRYPGTKTVEVRSGGQILAEVPHVVPARATVPVAIPLWFYAEGVREISLNPTLPVEVREASVRFVDMPAMVRPGASFHVRLVDPEDRPLGGILVDGAAGANRSDEQGVVGLFAPSEGPMHLVARIDGEVVGGVEVPVSTAGDSVGIGLDRIRIQEAALGLGTRVHVEATLSNFGGAGAGYDVGLLVDGVEVARSQGAVPTGERTTVIFEIGPLTAGGHTLKLAEFPNEIRVFVFDGPDPFVEAYLASGARHPSESPAPPVAIDAEANIDAIVGNIRLVVLALCVLSAAIATAGLVLVIYRQLAEAQPKVGILRALGASNQRVTAIVEREYAVRMAAGGAIGIALGLAAAEIIARSHLVRAFGHGIDAARPAWLILLLFTLAVGVAVATARGFVSHMLLTPIDPLMRGASLRPLPTDAPEIGPIVDVAD